MNFGALGRELGRRGHRVTTFHVSDLAPHIAAEGLDFVALPDLGFSLRSYLEMMSRQRGYPIRGFLDYSTKMARVFCESAPEAMQSAAIDGVVVDALLPGAATAAEAAGVPFITMCNAVPMHQEPAVPPDFLPWQHSTASLARMRNRFAYAIRDIVLSPLHRVLNQYRRQWSLRPYHSPDDSFSPFAQLSQLVPEFDLPRERLPQCFHYVGPYRRENPASVCFPYERLDGSPLVYASLGSVLGTRCEIWRAIIEACSELPVQLVIALGGAEPDAAFPRTSASTIIVKYAPQRELLKRAALAITHGGLNSAMEALASEVPMIAIPVTGDQFGVAARLAYTQTGEIISLSKCDGARVREAIRKVLGDPSYRRCASVIHASIEKSGGVFEAASIVEQTIITRQPVVRYSHAAVHPSQLSGIANSAGAG